MELCNEYEQTILFSTKTDQLYDVPVNPKFHKFQLSITHTSDDKYLETHAPNFDKRLSFYNELLDKGFNVGIRIQPFIPNITDITEIIRLFNDATHFTIESIKLVPGNPINNELKKYIKTHNNDWTQKGLLNLKTEYKVWLY